MSLLTGEKVTRVFQGNEVLRGVSFRIEEGDRIGLVGPNGAGKTTLLRIIAAADQPTLGTIHRRKGLRFSYLPQEPPALADVTLWQAVHEPLAGLKRLEEELHRAAEALSDARDPDAAMARYSALQHEFEARGGYTYEARVKSVLSGLGFTEDLYERTLLQLSGGQRTRALLSRVLLEDPELLLLDEPTNHLDLDAIEWLESWLREFKGSLVVVSHDRWFLEAVTNRIWDLPFGALEAYPVPYRQFLVVRAEREKERARVFEQQQDYIRKTEDFIARNLAGQRAREAKGRRTRLQRFVETEALDRPRERDEVRLNIGASGRSGNRVLQLRDLVIGYDPARPLVTVPDLEVWRGQRLVIVGPNGNGKTTLLKTLTGEIPALSGEVRLGAGVDVGYLSQAHDEMDPEATVLDTLLEVRGDRTIERVRTIAGAYLFRGDDVFKCLRELSVGQKCRVALAWMAMQGVNTLILDEPTNHLDIQSQEELQSVLVQFDGTILFVTHDRSLAQALATDIWCVEAGTVHEVRGGWNEYLSWRAERTRRPVATAAGKSREAYEKLDEERQQGHRQREKQRQQNARRIVALEDEIPAVESRLKALSAEIDQAGANQHLDLLTDLCLNYQRVEAELKLLWEEWERLSSEA